LFLPLATLAFITLVLGLYPQSVFAQFSSPGGGVDDSNGVFQLEGNATTDGGICFKVPNLIATPGAGNSCPAGFTFVAFGSQTDDWANINSGSGHFIATTGIVSDVINSSGDNIFTAGGSKDISGLQSGPWLWKNGKPQGKDDIEHAFAAAYSRSSDGHVIITFGMDRFDNSGDATAGFWFFQDSTVGLGGATSGSGTHFTGQHFDGDLLIVSDFSIGGAVSTIEVFKWTGNDASGSLTLEETLTSNATCNPITGSSGLCSIVNGVAGQSAPWGFIDKKSNTTFDVGEFLEGGIDLNAIFGSNVPCFTTFMAETRSSTSPTATLSDFSPPASFPLCSIGVTKACNGPGMVSPDGTSVAYSWTATVTNTGIGALSNVSLNDTLPNGSKVSIPVTSSLAAKASASVQVPFTATSSNVANPLSVTNSASAQGFSGPNGTGTLITSKPPDATAVCSATVGEMLTIVKHCDASKGGATLVVENGVVEVEVFYTAMVCNVTTPGTSGSQLTSITLADDHGSPLTHDSPSPSSIGSLNPGQCADVTGSYFPNSIDSALGRFGFTDTIRVTSAHATLGPNPTPVTGCPSGTDLACAPVTCPICFDFVCTNQPQP